MKLDPIEHFSHNTALMGISQNCSFFFHQMNIALGTSNHRTLEKEVTKPGC